MIQITPYLERSDVFNLYNYDLGWNVASNTTATSLRISGLLCPSNPTDPLLDGNPDLPVFQQPIRRRSSSRRLTIPASSVSSHG